MHRIQLARLHQVLAFHAFFAACLVGATAALEAHAQTAAPGGLPANAPELVTQIDALIDQLGDDSFHRREKAMAALIAIGPAAEGAVKASIDSDDPEVRYRCRKVLREIDRNLKAKRQAAFLEGDEDKLKINAESWQRLSKMIGNTRSSRELFVQMQVAAEDLLTEAEKYPDRCAARISQMYQQDAQLRRFGGKGTDPRRVAAMVFLAADQRIDLDSSALSRCVSLLYRYRTRFDEDDEAFKGLLGHWIDAKGEDIAQQYQFLRLAQQFKLPEGVELARKMVTTGRHSSYKAQAMLTLGQIGTKEDVALLQKQIDNDGRLGAFGRSGKKRKECKLGDVALAMCIVLSGEKLKDFGFKDAPEGRPSSTSYVHYGFYSDEARKAARQKWKEADKPQASK